MTLPNFIICGAQRSGTTSLYHYLAQHPDVFMTPRKETHYFSKNYANGQDWYEHYFAGAEQFKVIGEASPTYMDGQGVPERMSRLLPDAKLCFLLRNPIDRVYSAYWFDISSNQDPTQSFSDMIRTRFGYEQYIKRGFYHAHIERFSKYYARSQIHFIIAKELGHNSLEQVALCFRFLQVDATFVPNTQQKFNASRVVSKKSSVFFLRKWRQAKLFLLKQQWVSPVFRRKTSGLRDAIYRFIFSQNQKPSISPEDHAYLTEIYREHNARLAEFLGCELLW